MKQGSEEYFRKKYPPRVNRETIAPHLPSEPKRLTWRKVEGVCQWCEVTADAQY